MSITSVPTALLAFCLIVVLTGCASTSETSSTELYAKSLFLSGKARQDADDELKRRSLAKKLAEDRATDHRVAAIGGFDPFLCGGNNSKVPQEGLRIQQVSQPVCADAELISLNREIGLRLVQVKQKNIST